ncbi:hypothetical protein [Roseateles asaccharophilus]|uniref:Uncharacterized protein n=1 Tax=Roseateles asaccharophilus TaxID=582607 RepID=A0ABU2ACX0_9BURK|nr:hypothetical protein [Roseateles asaccharophilus]MDR7335048.1 hypothetical protein [Roseateles asaccharophilus]
MWNQRAALAALLLLCASDVQAQRFSGCLKHPPLQFPAVVSWPKVPKFFADMELAEDPTGPLKVSVIYTNFPTRLREHVVRHLESGRWVCEDKPDAKHRFNSRWTFVSEPRPKFSESKVTLARFVEMVKPAPDAPLNFNVEELGCPFVVKWQTFRPVAPNRVSISFSGPKHKPFRQWLENVEIDGPKSRQLELIGEELEISVPCERNNLAPPDAAASSPP